MFPGTTHVLPLTTVRRDRLLISPGYVMVEEGVRVEASTIVAKTTTPGKHFIYDLVRRLGVKAEEANQFVKVKIGVEVEKGKLLATKPGLLGAISIKAPTRGKVIAVEGGRMLYESSGAIVELRAGFGVLRGSTLAAARLCRCHPFHPGGVDLPPERSPRLGEPS